MWRQIAASILECPVVCPANTEAGALGAALQAMWCYRKHEGNDVSLEQLTDECVRLEASTRVDPDAAAVAAYKEIYGRYLALNESMKGMNS